MKYLVQVLVFIAFLPLNAEPLYELLRKYADDYLSIIDETEKIEDAVRGKYRETFFVERNDAIVEVLSGNEVKDTLINEDMIWIRIVGYRAEDIIVEYDYNTLNFLMDTIKTMIEASVPQINLLTNSMRVKTGLVLSTELEEKIEQFNFFLEDLVYIASIIKNEDSSFLPQYDSLKSPGDLEYWPKWYKVVLRIDSLEIERSLYKFEIRYGENSEKINLIELVFINHLPPFKGNADGPSHWEPILRFTPVCYNFTDNRFVKTFQIGVNYYFFEDGFFKLLHHIGIAFLLADVESEKIYEVNNLSIGVQVHLGKCQLGIVKDRRDNSLKFISTVDFQIIPSLF